jgi:hypothetical protein
MRLLVTALVAAVLAVAGCSHDTELKETPEQIRQEQVSADAHNASTSTTNNPEAPPTTDPDIDPAGFDSIRR